MNKAKHALPWLGIFCVTITLVALTACALSEQEVSQIAATQIAASQPNPGRPVPSPSPSSLLLADLDLIVQNKVATALIDRLPDSSSSLPVPTPSPSSLFLADLDLIVEREVDSALKDRLAEPTHTPSPSFRRTPVPEQPPPIVWSSEALKAGDNALTVFLDVRTNVPSQLEVQYGNEAVGWFKAPATNVAATKHRVPLLRLRAGSDYSYEIVAVDSSGRRAPRYDGTFATQPLPPHLAGIRLSASGTSTADLILADYRTASSTGYLILDNLGEIVWYLDLSTLFPEGSPGPVVQLADYSLMTIVHGVGLVEFSPLGDVKHKVLSSERGYFHHDIREINDGGIIAIADVPATIDLLNAGLGKEERVAVATLRVVNFTTGQDDVVWNALDHIPIEERNPDHFDPWSVVGGGRDWLHLNTITLTPDSNYILSSPTLSTIYLIDGTNGNVLWRLGGDRSDFRFLDESDRFYFQHTPIMLPNGNIVLFDNGGGEGLGEMRPVEFGTYSRGLELELNIPEMTARKVWEYRHEPDHISPTISGVQRLENGNTLVNFGRRPVTLVEVDEDGRGIWTLADTSDSMTYLRRYRSQTIESIGGEIIAGSLPANKD